MRTAFILLGTAFGLAALAIMSAAVFLIYAAWLERTLDGDTRFWPTDQAEKVVKE